MKNLIIKNGLCLLSILLGFAACNENIHDFTKKTDSSASNSIYIADSIFTYSLSWSADTINTGTSDAIIAKFPVYLREIAENDVEVTLEKDDNLIKVYNDTHGTSYLAIYKEDLLLQGQSSSGMKVTIPQGQNRSPDSIKIQYRYDLRNLLNTNGYLIPVRIKTHKGMDVEPDYKERICYLIINVKQENGIYFKDRKNVAVNYTSTADYTDLNTLAFNLNAFYAVTADSKVKLSVNNSLIADWNKEKGTDYQPVPTNKLAQSYEIDFSQGTKEKSGKLSYTGDATTLTDSRGYLIPLEITSVTGDFINSVKARKVLYILIDVSKLSCAVVSPESEIGGTIVTDRSKYVAVNSLNSLTGSSINSLGNMFIDGTSDWRITGFSSGKASFTVDLGEEVENIAGIQLHSYLSTTTLKTLDVKYATRQMFVKDLDVAIGKIRHTAGINQMFIKFSEPVTARYIIINDYISATTAVGLQQFYIYKSN